MGKKNNYQCSQCKQSYTKWQGQCWNCKSWNSIDAVSKLINNSTNNPINESSGISYKTKIENIDRIFYNGIPQKAFVLFGGEPGVGKSTLVTQLVGNITNNLNAIYFAGEESVDQITSRFKRFKIMKDNIQVIKTISLEEIKRTTKRLKANIIIIDSIQTLRENDIFSSSSSMSKLRNIVYELNEFVSYNNILCLCICHINKTGNFSGPKTIEHMVDTSIIMKKENDYRKLHVLKNRFGEADVIAKFSMTEKGLVPILKNKINLSNEDFFRKGVCYGLNYQGQEFEKAEIQSIAIRKNLKVSKQIVKGFNKTKFNILLAMIETQMKIPISDYDIFCDVLSKRRDLEYCELALVASIIGAILHGRSKRKYLFIGIVDLTSQIRIDKKMESLIDTLIIDNDIQIVTSYMYNGINKNVYKLKFAKELTSLLSGEINEQKAS